MQSYAGPESNLDYAEGPGQSEDFSSLHLELVAPARLPFAKPNGEAHFNFFTGASKADWTAQVPINTWGSICAVVDTGLCAHIARADERPAQPWIDHFAAPY